VKKVLVFLVLVGAIAAFLYFPRTAAVVSAANAATLAVLNTAVEGSRAGSSFAPALDGEVYSTGDLIRANADGRAVLTFFDGTTLSMDPGSQVKVVTLNHLPADGIQVSIEQALGRSWSAVQKLKTPDSRYEVKTPSSNAVVRGTAFDTLVQRLPNGNTETTYRVDEGALQVTASAGGTVTVPAGAQVTIAEGAPAPVSPVPIASTSRVEITGSAGLGFLAVAPTGQSCGPMGGKAEIFGCIAAANKITVREPVAGRWGLALTSAAALAGATITVEAFVGAARQAVRAFSRAFNANELVRTGLTLTAGPPVALSAFEDPLLVTSVCAATAPGRVFGGGAPNARLDVVRTFARENKNLPVSLVFTEADLNQAGPTSIGGDQGLRISGQKVTIDAAGVHGTATAALPFVTVTASADFIGGPVGGKFSLRLARLSAESLPPGLVDAVRSLADVGTVGLGESIPFQVRQVSFRAGCFFLSGMTPP